MFLTFFLDSLTPKLVYIETEQVKSVFDNGDKMMSERHIKYLLFF